MTSQSNLHSTERHGRQRRQSAQQNEILSQVPPKPGQVQKPTGPFHLGSASSFKKLSNFFGVEPPRLQNLKSFLEDLGYLELLPVSVMGEENY